MPQVIMITHDDDDDDDDDDDMPQVIMITHDDDDNDDDDDDDGDHDDMPQVARAAPDWPGLHQLSHRGLRHQPPLLPGLPHRRHGPALARQVSQRGGGASDLTTLFQTFVGQMLPVAAVQNGKYTRTWQGK